MKYASRYNATGITPHPPFNKYVSTGFNFRDDQTRQSQSAANKDLIIPDGYEYVALSAILSGVAGGLGNLVLQLGNESYPLKIAPGQILQTLNVTAAQQKLIDAKEGTIPLSVVCYDVGTFAVNVTVKCKLVGVAAEGDTQLKWQLQTFDSIYTAYKALLTEYNQKVKEAQAQAASAIAIEGRNPLINLETIKSELKKQCITMLTGQHFAFKSMIANRSVPGSNPEQNLPEIDILEALDRGPIIQFFEQAFDWQQITYLFYPYFWARKPEWVAKSTLSDPDPLFTHFLQAGAVRVVLAASPHYEDAVRYFLEDVLDSDWKKRIWQGGGQPVLERVLKWGVPP